MIIRIVLLSFILFAECQIYANNVNTKLLDRDAKGETWAGRKKCNLSLPMTQQHIRSQMQKLGFKEKYEIKLDSKGNLILLLFVKDKQQKLFMLRRLNVDSTEYYWGDINDKK